MKKTFYTFIAILLFGAAQAKQVSVVSAQKAATNFFKTQSNYQNPVVMDVFTAHYDAVTTFYAFSFVPKGFVIVSADDNISPVLAYSKSGFFDKNNIPSSVKEWLKQYSKGIYKAIESKQKNTLSENEWSRMLAGNIARNVSQAVSPLCTTLWGQECYYNGMCPADTLGGPCGHAVTGCVATAMAQIMKYWNYPVHGQGSHSYNSNVYGPLFADFGAATYNWASMPDSINSSNLAIAMLMYHCGVSVDMDYNSTSSGSSLYNAKNAWPAYFKYSNDIEDIYKANYTDSSWIDLLKSELNAGRPVLYGGFDTIGNGGHAWVCDGYDNSDFFHFNWGYGPGYNGYYQMGNFVYYKNNEAVIRIMPVVGCDMSVAALIAPVSKTFTGPSVLKVRVVNNDTLPHSNIPISYTVDGGPPVNEVISGTIAGLSDTVYAFTQPYDFSLLSGHFYTVKIYSGLSCDSYHGNDTLTTQIENVACASPPYAMGFEPSEDLNGWVMLNPDSDASTWEITHPGGNSQPYCAYYNGSDTAQGNDWLISKCLELNANKMYKLSYFYKISNPYPSVSNHLDLFIGTSQDPSALVTRIASHDSIVNSNYQKASVYFTVPATGSYYIGWYDHSNPGADALCIDDINIVEQDAIDVGLGSTNLTEDNCGLQTENIAVTVRNRCSTALTNIPVSYSVNGSSPVTDTIATIAIGDSVMHTFSAPVDLSATGTYHFVFYTSLAGDTISNNDTITEDVVNHASVAPDYSMGFEPTDDFSGWKVDNDNNDAYTWTIKNTGGRTQPYCIRYDYSSWLPADDWFVSQCIKLDSAQTYQLDFWYKCEDAQWPEKLKVFIGTAQQTAAMDTLLIDLPNIVNSNYQEATVYFTVPSNNLYYIGWYCYSDAAMFNLYVDDIFLTDLTTSVENHNLATKFVVFPNPVSDKLTIENPGISKDLVTYKLENIDGALIKQVVSSSNKVSIATSGLAKGVYLLEISSPQGNVVKKIVK